MALNGGPTILLGDVSLLSAPSLAQPVMHDPFAAITSGLGTEDWLLLGVCASERKLTPGMLGKLGRSPSPHRWLATCVEQGLLLDAGVVHGFGYPYSPEPEHALAVNPIYRPLILRGLAERGELEAVARAGRIVVGEGSLCPLMTALYGGDLALLQREQQALQQRSVRGEEVPFVRRMLREAVCASIEGNWLERTWGDWAWPLAEQVLADALPSLDAVEELYQWVLERAEPSASARLTRLIAEHALLRGDSSTARSLASNLPRVEQVGLRAAAAFVDGDLAGARQGLDALERWKGGKPAPEIPSVTVLLALLALQRDASGAAFARRLLPRGRPREVPAIVAWPSANSHGEVARALRAMFRRLTQPEVERRRLSAHQVLSNTPSWVLLISGLTAKLQEADGVTRIAWAHRLLEDGTGAQTAGYSWFARQMLHLARSLSPNASPGLEALAPCQPGEQLLCDLIEPEPEWRRALEALAGFVQTAERAENVVSRRVAWYVDMVGGALAKPELEEFRSDRGWTRARRMQLSELHGLRDTLPVEDSAVLQSLLPESHYGTASAQVFEALIGHPRVFNGARGRSPVEIVRGVCRVETRHEHGHLVVQVEPARAQEGVNIVVEGEGRIAVYRVSATLARLISLIPHGIRVPEPQQHEALPLLARLAAHVEIRSPSLGARHRVGADPTPCLRISPEAGAWWVEVGVHPFGEHGRFFPPGLGRMSVTVHTGEALLDTERDLEAERARFRELLAVCPSLQAAAATATEDAGVADEPSYGFTLSEEELFSLLTEIRGSDLACALEWRNGHAITPRGTLSTGNIHGSLRRVKGWYLVTGGIDIDTVTPTALADLITMPFTKSGRFLRLPSGDFVEVEQRLRHVLKALASCASRPKPGAGAELRVPEGAFSVVKALVESSDGVRVDATASDRLELVKATLQSEPVVPETLLATLRPYQLEGFRWLARFSQLGLGVCLADDMGLGKTVQVLGLLLMRASAGPALVVAPTSVCRNWLDEIRRFAPSLRAVEYVGRGREALLDPLNLGQASDAPHVLIASYALLQQDAARLGLVEWNTVVLDEAQFIKNPRSLRAKAAFTLDAPCRVALTGTPVENHLGDLWSIFHFASPTLLGSWKHFQLSHLKPSDGADAGEQRAALKRLIQPYLLRRRKDEVLRELPPVTTLRHEVRLSEDETMRYALLRRQIHEKLRTSSGKRQHKLQILAEITRLRRFCCHPRLVFPEAGAESAKIQAFLQLAEELHDNGHHALVFSQFVDFLDLVRAELEERGLRYLYLDGSTPKERRHTLVQAFQGGEAELFLISLKAGGFGLNLTAADYVIHLDPWWNPAVEAQATDRAHRIGQHKPVTVYRLITHNTIEESIVALHEDKRAIAAAVLEGSEIAADLDGDQLMALLSLDAES